MANGTIRVSTDPNYAPQSLLKPDGTFEGFDIDVATEIAKRLGVEVEFVTPEWDIITAGNWGDQWDMSVGSMTITTARQQILDFSVPYYYTPAVVAVRADSGLTDLAGLEGEALCAGAATTYESWLNHDMEALGLPESSIYAQAPNVSVVPLPTDQECAQAIAAGREDFIAYATSATVVDANIAAGMPVVKIETPIYYEQLAAAFDKSSSLPTDTLRAEVDKVFTAMHEDGRLSELSNQWFGMDITKANE
jgi:polar amino acid transport system substrate-binding protein